MTKQPEFHEIRGLFAHAHGHDELPEALQDTPQVIYYAFYEVDAAIPVIIGFAKSDEADPDSMVTEDDLEPVIAQHLRRAPDGEWEWALADPKLMLTALNYGDRVNVEKFRSNVDLFLERRENPDVAVDPMTVANDD